MSPFWSAHEHAWPSVRLQHNNNSRLNGSRCSAAIGASMRMLHVLHGSTTMIFKRLHNALADLRSCKCWDILAVFSNMHMRKDTMFQSLQCIYVCYCMLHTKRRMCSAMTPYLKSLASSSCLSVVFFRLS